MEGRKMAKSLRCSRFNEKKQAKVKQRKTIQGQNNKKTEKMYLNNNFHWKERNGEYINHLKV